MLRTETITFKLSEIQAVELIRLAERYVNTENQKPLAMSKLIRAILWRELLEHGSVADVSLAPFIKGLDVFDAGGVPRDFPGPMPGERKAAVRNDDEE